MVRRSNEAEGWKIARDRTRCERPGCPLPTAESWIALLEFPDCVRRDLCDACFAARRQERSDDVYWRARRRREGVRTGPVLDLPALRGLFDRLGEVGVGEEDVDERDAPGEGRNPETSPLPEADAARAEQLAGLRYFVALLLIRKRLLKIVDPRTEAEEMADLVVVDPKDGEMEPVALYAPPLEEDRLSRLKDELIAALDETQD